MATPAYHLRTNKAVDRFLFVDLLKRLIHPHEADEYRYYSFGGPYLEDFSIVHSVFPSMEMVSIERDENVFLRQKFHKNSSKITLKHSDILEYIDELPKDKKAIFWLDFTGFKPEHLNTYMKLVSGLPEGSIIRLSVEVSPNLYVNPRNADGEKYIKGNHDKEVQFKRLFDNFLAIGSGDLENEPLIFAKTIQSMIAVAAQRVLPSGAGALVVQPLCSFYYKDGAGMLTHTGLIRPSSKLNHSLDRLEGWPYVTYSWVADVELLEMPVLSTKERLSLQELLPCGDANALSQHLGYNVEGEDHIHLMNQYSKFYKEYPLFIRANI